MRDVYVLESNIIAGTTITENMRAVKIIRYSVFAVF